MLKIILSSGFLIGIISLLIFLQPIVACAQTAIEQLNPVQLIERRLKGGEINFFNIAAESGNCVRLVVVQKGIDVMIVIKDADGKKIKEVDRPSGSYGRETVTFVIPHTAIYSIEISTWDKIAPTGIYQISFTKADTPTATDVKRDLAENLTSEGESLRGAGTGKSKQKALEKFSEALQIWTELGESYEQAVIYYGLGFTHQGLGNYFDAAIFYNRALEIMIKIGDEFGQAVNHTALGSVEYVLNENELSVYNYKKAIEIYRKMNNARGLGAAFAGLGTVESLLENYSDAVAHWTESLRWRNLANDKSGKARTHISLGKLYLYLKSYSQAEQQIIEAEKSLKEIGKENDADLLYYFGRLYLETGKTEKAREKLQKALQVSRETGGKLSEANILYELSRTQMQSNDFYSALEDIQLAVGIIEQLRQSTSDFRARINFSATIQPFYARYISLLMKMHDREPVKGFDLKALQISEQARLRGLLDRLERRRLVLENNINPELIERERKLTDRLTGVLADHLSNRTDEFFVESLKVSAQYAEVETEINRKFNSTETVLLPTSTTEQIQQLLDDDTVLLEYDLTEDEGFLWLATKTAVKSFRLPPGMKIENQAREVYQCLLRPNTDADCSQKIRKLSRILLQPVATEINNKRLVVVKNGFLQYIPFTALTVENKHFLIETNEIINLPSASLLSFLRRKSDTAPTKTLAIFADPIYSSDDKRVVKINSKNTANSFTKQLTDGLFPRLFASRFEAERIAAFVSPQNLLKITDAKASRETLLAAGLNEYRILHFATHTLINDKEPELSAIVLSFYDLQGVKIDGFLRSNDILRLNLNADLVTLSACQSGLGKQIKGEGIISLAHSFFSVGTKRLLISLWNVDDKVTAELMIRFYRKHFMESKSIAVALRQSQIEILHDKRWNAPFYWSAFVLQGDWQ